MPITALFDSSAVILYFNDALSSDALAMMEQATDQGTGAISVVTRAEVLAWPQHTAKSLQEAIVGMASFDATSSHSNSVGNRAPDQRAKASASKKFKWQAGVLGSTLTRPCNV